MKRLFADSPHTKLIAAASAFVWTIAIVTSAGAAQLQEARVTQVVNDVKLLLEQAAPRPAALTDLIRRGTALRTGTQSRSELTFADLTITRLGANTIFSFKEGTREMNLVDGAILFQVPKGSGGATIRTVGVTAAITGTTGIGEFHPATTSHPLSSKWLCLEGKIVLHLPNGQSVELGPGEMVTTDGKSFSQVLTFDIAKLVSTSLFFIGFDRPLPSLDLIMLAAQNQLTSGLLATNPLDPIRLVDVISQVTVAEQTEVSPPPPPPVSPTPSKFGTPAVISSPDPYLITNGTVIKTDPSITTNGVTDYGKIYRGQSDDGAFSLWAFGSTSPFDAPLDTTFFADPNHLPLAVFKFQSLSLTGNPTIDLSNGGVTKLGLIGVDGITSGPPGGTLTFTGLDLLVLATVNGSINLTSDVSFQGLNELAMYARGAGSNLTINSPITNIGILELAAEDSIHLTNPGTMSVGEFDAITGGGNLTLQIGGSLLLNGAVRLDATVLPGATVASGANLTLNVTGDYTNNSATEFSRFAITNQGHIGTGGNIAVDIGGDLTAMNDFNLVVQNTNGQIDNGGNITLAVGGSINVGGALDATLDNTGGLIGNDTSITITSSGAVTAQGDANFQILNNDGGQIGGNANISVTTGGDITANSILGFVNNHNGGAITSGANISFNIGGALNTQGDATFIISNLNEGPGGGTIGSLASLDINAASISVGGFFQTFVGANAGGSITGNASNTVNLTGDLVVQGPILADIQDTGFNQINPINFIAGGHIGGNATVTLSAQNITTFSTASGIPGIDTMALEASIYSNGSGTIGGDAIVNVSASQDISAPGTVFFTVANGNYMGFGGGTIGGDAKLNISAVNFMAGILFAEIFNYGASIGGNANINFNLTGDLTAPGDAIFHIFNYGGGNIVGNAAINVNSANITANSLLAEIDNSSAGQIGGNALINFGVSGDVNITEDASFQILNNAGMIGGDTEINVNAANITANSLLAQIDNSNGGTIGANANISIATGGDFATSVGDAAFTINNTAGTITNNANLALNAGGSISTAGELSLLLENNDESGNPAGHIGGSANVSLTAGGNLTADFASIVINNRNGGRIDSSASLTLNIGGALTTLHNGTDFLGGLSSLTLDIANRYENTLGSTIGGDATLLFHSNTASIGGVMSVTVSDKGGTIDGNALLNFSVTHDMTAQGADNVNFQGESAATWQILNDSATDSPLGGTIHGDATLLLSATNLAVPAGSLEVDIRNQNFGVVGPGGTIDSSANITFNLSGNLTTQGDATFHIQNAYTGTTNPGGTAGGTIGQDAILNLSANGLSIGGGLDTSIRNAKNAGDNGGSIGGSAAINLAITGVISALDDSQLISNSGGTIGSDAMITVSAGGVSTTDTAPGSFSVSIANASGSIGGDTSGGSATINFGLTGALAVASDATFSIDNSGSGMIGSDATVSVSAAGISADSLLAQINNGNGGMIGGAANVAVNIGNNVTVANGITLQILNGNSGHIVTGANVLYSVGGTTSTTGLTESIDNTNGGAIDHGGNITLHTVGPVMLDGGFLLETDNFNGGTINNGADVTAHFVGDVTATVGEFHSFNFHVVNGGANFVGDVGGGTIGTGGNIDVTFDRNAATTGTATTGSFSAQVANDHGNLGTGGNMSVTIGGNLTCGPLFVLTSNRYGGQIGTGGNITLDVAGNVSSAGEAFLGVLNQGGRIGSGTNVTLNVGGDLTAQASAEFSILNNNDGSGSGGGTIGGNATVTVDLGNITSSGPSGVDSNALVAQIDNRGGSIGSNAIVNFAATGNVDAHGNVFLQILNFDDGASGSGTINGDAILNVSAANFSTASLLYSPIDNSRGGSITGSANLNYNLTGDLTTQASAEFSILNNNDGSGSGGGTIGGNATVTVDLGNITSSGPSGVDSNALVAQIDNRGGSIGGNAIVNFAATGNVDAHGGVFLQVLNFDRNRPSGSGTINGDAILNVSAANFSTASFLHETIGNSSGSSINGNATLTFTLTGDLTSQGDFTSFQIENDDAGNESGGGTIAGNATLNVSANNITASALFPGISNSGGNIGSAANVALTLTGDLTTQGDASFNINNSTNGTIGSGAMMNVTANNISSGGALNATIDNSGGGTIGGSANINFNLTGNLTSQGDANFQILNNDAGQIGGNGNISVTTGGDLTANSIFAFINNRNGGAIGSAANINFDIGGALSTTGDATFVISNRNDGSDGGTIGGNVSLTLSAASISGGGILVTDVSTNQGGHIMGSAHNTVDAAGLLSGGTLDFEIENAGFDTGGGFEPGGTIDADAILSVTASDISTTSDYFNEIIANDGGGHIGGNATVSVLASSMDVATNAYFNILNGQNGAGTPTGSIGGNAAIDVAAATLSIGGNLNSGIDNSGGSISGMAQIIFNLAGNLATQGDALFAIDNSFDGEVTSGTIGSDATINISANNISTGGSLSAVINNSINPGDGFIGGTIGGDAMVNVGAASITANSLLAQIDNTGGSIGASTEGGATINMNVSGTANVTNDATVAIYGSDGAVGGAAININGGNYNVGGTFLCYIDGNGTIAFNNINAHADVLKAGVFGANGVLRIGGGMLSADSTLKLYAPGSNGQLNFISNVTLGGNSAKILAANSVTIFNNIVVTIGGPNPADVYTNNPNYSQKWGGNGTTTGTFAGAGANNPLPLASAPPFGPASPVKLTIGGNVPSATAVPPQSAPGRTPAPGGNITSRTRIPPTLPSNVLTNGKVADVKRASNVINVRSSDELLSLLEDAAPGPGGKITIPPSKSASNSKNSNRTNVPGRVNSGSRVNVDRRAMDMRTASSSVIRHSPQ